MIRFSIAFALLTFGSLWPFRAAAQARASVLAPASRFAVEFPTSAGASPFYVTVPDNPNARTTSFLTAKSLHFLPTPASQRKPSLVEFTYHDEGDKVFVTVTACYGTLNPNSFTDSLQHLTRETVGTGSGGLNQSIQLDVLARVGVAPIALRIVTALPAHPWQPAIISNAPSLRIEYAPVDREFSIVTIHNFSNKLLTGLRITTPSDDGREATSQDVGMYRGIAPGKTYEMRFSVPATRRKEGDVWVDVSRPSKLVIEAAIFGDGSYEGDPKIAATMDARQMGHQAELQLLNTLIAPILADTTATNDTRITRILAVIHQLPETPNPEMLVKLRGHFPDLSQQDLTAASQALTRSMSMEKRQSDFMVRQFQTHILPRHPNLQLAQWWAVTHGN